MPVGHGVRSGPDTCSLCASQCDPQGEGLPAEAEGLPPHRGFTEAPAYEGGGGTVQLGLPPDHHGRGICHEGKVTAPWPHGLLSKKAVQLKRPLSRDQSPYSDDLRLGSHWWPGHQDTFPCHLHPEGREPAGPLRSLVLLGLAAAALPLEHETEKGPCSTGVVPARDLLASRECVCLSPHVQHDP